MLACRRRAEGHLRVRSRVPRHWNSGRGEQPARRKPARHINHPVMRQTDLFHRRSRFSTIERTRLQTKVIGLYTVLIAANGLAWAWAFVSFCGYPLLLATALIAYGFGLRHAVDADHIAAIDNTTRKLMQEGKRPIMVGFFFRSATRLLSLRPRS
jgi:fatty acid desaturase